MYVCTLCSFSCLKRREWDLHQDRTGHDLQDNLTQEDTNSDTDTETDLFSNERALNDALNNERALNDAFNNERALNDAFNNERALSDSDSNQTVGDPPDNNSPPDSPQGQDPWYPWLSRCHYYLSVLYHGSHRRNMDKETLRAVMDIMKVYVPKTEFFPTIDQVVKFTHEHWYNRILETRIDQGNVFTFLRPEGILAMRMANPIQSKSFDRVPRKNHLDQITTQSSSEKFQSFNFLKLGDFLTGDLLKLNDIGEISMQGYDEKVACQLYFHITGFFIKNNTYKVEGKYFFHSSLSEMRYLRDRVNDNDCYIMITNMTEDLDLAALKYEQTLRSENMQANYSRYMYNETTPSILYMLPQADLRAIQNRLTLSEQEGCINIIVNIHVDDASQVQSKMWKSASVCDIQLAGAPAGVKGRLHKNHLRCW